MTTRARSRASQQKAKHQVDEDQTKITDAYDVTRKKLNKTKFIKETITEEDVVSKPTTTRTKRVKKEVLPNEQPLTTVSQPAVLDSPPRRPRKTPTPPCSPMHGEHPTAVRRLFANAEKNKDSEEPTSSTFPFGISAKKTPQKPRTIADLQARLVSANPALAKVHEQMIANAAKQVEKRAELLRSPAKAPVQITSPVKKIAPLFTSPAKRLPTIKIADTNMQANTNTPYYVLPTHRTPAKERDEEEEQKQKETIWKSQLARLRDEIKQSSKIELPKKYLQLLERFESHDRIISLFSGRGMRCEANVVFKNVMANIKMEFNRKHLAQILNLYPNSYTLCLDEIRKISGKPSGEYELIITPNLSDDLSGFMNSESPQKAIIPEAPLPKIQPGPCRSPMKSPRKKCAVPVPRDVEIDVLPKLEGWRMLCRKYIMRHFLAQKVLNCHQLFMKKLEGVVGEFKRFHPSFLERMNEECPNIEPAPLPEPPRRDGNFSTVGDFMKTVKQPETAVDVAIKELLSENEHSVSRNIPLSPKKFAQLQAAKPKGTMSLLERIRAKEAAKKAVEDKRDPESERRYYRLNLLHEKVMRPLLLLFIRGQCRSIELQKAIDKIEATVKSSKVELKECLELLPTLTSPDIAQITEVCGSKYLQIEKTAHERLRDIVKSAFDAVPTPTTCSIKGR